jgi:cystathionine beta-lyase family protein involved in aluminum resistance
MDEAYHALGIPDEVLQRAEQAERRVGPIFRRIAGIRAHNQLRVLAAMRNARVSESAFGGSTGYGYDDRGREALEAVYAEVFGTEAALVRPQICAGTQAIAMCLFGVLRPGDLLVSITGRPYDTLDSVIGLREGGYPGSLADFGVRYAQVDLAADGGFDEEGVLRILRLSPRMIYIQKSRGYAARRSLLVEEIGRMVEVVRKAGSDAAVLVDNCYGEFTERMEPGSVGVDLVAGSLIKNPGGGISPTGGYVAGRRDLVELAAARLTAPGLGSHVGPTLGLTRLMTQGFFLAPHMVGECLMGAVFTAAFFEGSGYPVDPGPTAPRGDIIQSITLGDADRLVRFCRAIQTMAPVDSFVSPEPWAMPGYADPVVMAAGAFVQGASLELSADAPMRAPYRVFLQGGLVYEQVKAAAMLAVCG